MVTRRRFTRREILEIGGLGLTTAYLAGCGGGDGGGAEGQGVGVDVTWDMSYAGKPGSMQKYWAELRKRLEESDEGATIANLTGVALPDLQQRLQAAHAAKQGAVIEPWYPNFLDFLFVEQGVLEPLDDWVGGDQEIEDWLFREPLIDGKIYGMPWLAEQAPLVINAEHFQAAGVEYGTRFGSWEEVVAACEALKKSGVVPVMMGVSDGFQTERWIMASELEFMNKPSEFTRIWAGEASFDDPVVISWIDRLTELRDKQYINDDASKITDQQAQDRFLEGEGAMLLTAGLGKIFAAPPGQFDLIGFWTGPGTLQWPVLLSGDVLMMTNYGENKEAAGKLLQFMQKPEQLALFNETTGEFPCNRNFDAGNLGELARKDWEEFLNTDNPPNWPHNFGPFDSVPILYDIAPRLIAGADPDEIRSEYERRVETDWLDRNPQQVEIVKKYLDILEAQGL